MSITADKQERFHFLDGIRGIAAMMIVMHHALSSNIAKLFDHAGLSYVGYFFQNFTQSGVDLFFVLSGVVLLRPYLRGERKLKVFNYFKRRLFRIYPPYIVAVLFGAFVIWFNNRFATWYNERGIHEVFTWPETIKQMGIISFSGRFYNLAWWSLGIEVLFYLFVPLVIIIFPRGSKLTDTRVWLTIAGTVAGTLLLQLGMAKVAPHIYNLDSYFVSIGRAVDYPVCFLMGILLATRDFNAAHARIFLFSGLALIIGGLVLVKYSLIYYSVLHTGFGLAYAGIITFAFIPGGFRELLSKPLMIWLGERSYSLFLVHFSVFYLVDNLVSHLTPERNATYGILTRGVGIPLGVFAGMLLFHFVERWQARGLVTGHVFWPWQLNKSRDTQIQKPENH